MRFEIDTNSVESLCTAITDGIATPKSIAKWCGYSTRDSGNSLVLPGWCAISDGKVMMRDSDLGYKLHAKSIAWSYANRIDHGQYERGFKCISLVVNVWREGIDDAGTVHRINDNKFNVVISGDPYNYVITVDKEI